MFYVGILNVHFEIDEYDFIKFLNIEIFEIMNRRRKGIIINFTKISRWIITEQYNKIKNGNFIEKLIEKKKDMNLVQRLKNNSFSL